MDAPLRARAGLCAVGSRMDHQCGPGASKGSGGMIPGGVPNSILPDRQLQDLDACVKDLGLFQKIFDASPDAVVLTRMEDGVVVNVNAAFQGIFGFEAREVIGRPVLDLGAWLRPVDRRVFISELRELGSVTNRRISFQSRNGGSVDCLLSARLLLFEPHTYLLSVIRDVTEIKLYEKHLRVVNRFLSIANQPLELPLLLQAFLSEIKTVSECGAAAIRVLLAGDRIQFSESEGLIPPSCGRSGFVKSRSRVLGLCSLIVKGNSGPLADFFTARGAFFADSVSLALAEAPKRLRSSLLRSCACLNSGYETMALIPIQSSDRLIGLIHLADKSVGKLIPESMHILENAAKQVGAAIERVQLAQALKHSHQELEKRVLQRTKQLSRANRKLLREIEEHRKAERELLRNQDLQRRLSSELLQARERERRRVASEIHDHIGQNLAVAKIQLGAVHAALNEGPLRDSVSRVRDLISQAVTQTRSLTFELSPPVLYELGLFKALNWLAENIRQKSQLEVSVVADGMDAHLDASRRVLLFQAARELLFNVVKHARASHAEVLLSSGEKSFLLSVADNGVGFDPRRAEAGRAENDDGFGLFNIRDQIQWLGGHFSVTSSHGRGARVEILLPYGASPAKSHENRV